jgi:hypothetical protein
VTPQQTRALTTDTTSAPTMFEPVLTYYADGTAVVMQTPGTSRTGTTAGIKTAFPYAFQLVDWPDGTRGAVAPHVLRRAPGQQVAPARQLPVTWPCPRCSAERVAHGHFRGLDMVSDCHCLTCGHRWQPWYVDFLSGIAGQLDDLDTQPGDPQEQATRRADILAQAQTLGYTEAKVHAFRAVRHPDLEAVAAVLTEAGVNAQVVPDADGSVCCVVAGPGEDFTVGIRRATAGAAAWSLTDHLHQVRAQGDMTWDGDPGALAHQVLRLLLAGGRADGLLDYVDIVFELDRNGFEAHRIYPDGLGPQLQIDLPDGGQLLIAQDEDLPEDRTSLKALNAHHYRDSEFVDVVHDIPGPVDMATVCALAATMHSYLALWARTTRYRGPDSEEALRELDRARLRAIDAFTHEASHTAAACQGAEWAAVDLTRWHETPGLPVAVTALIDADGHAVLDGPRTESALLDLAEPLSGLAALGQADTWERITNVGGRDVRLAPVARWAHDLARLQAIQRL